MKKYLTQLGGCFLFAVLTLVASAAEFRAAVDGYEKAVTALDAAEPDGVVKAYLDGRLLEIHTLDGLDSGDARLPAALSALVQRRLDLNASLDPAVRRAPAAREEEHAYTTHMANYINGEYIQLIRLQDDLLKRKYFQTETAANANFLEGIVNSYWGLTRTEQGNPRTILLERPTLGVSPWEAIFRLEPTLALRDGPQGAIMGTAGLSYAFFPMLRRDAETVTFDETFASKVVKKWGPRAGIGAGRFGDNTRLLVGAGVQVNALGIWCLYEPHAHVYMLGLGLADLDKLKKWLGWF